MSFPDPTPRAGDSEEVLLQKLLQIIKGQSGGGGGGGAVDSVNGETGIVVLNADDVGAIPSDNDPIFIGVDAGESSGATSGAIFVGKNAGRNSTLNGFAPVMIGEDAGMGSSSIGATYVIGKDAGRDSSGPNLIAVGKDAGRSGAGNGVIAFGNQSMQSAVGDETTGLGHYAGIGSSANGCVYIGHKAGRSNDGDYCVFIGEEAGDGNVTAGEFAIRQVALNSAPLIRGNFTTGLVEIPGALKYVPGTPGNWAGTAPVTVAAALNRLAAATPGA